MTKKNFHESTRAKALSLPSGSTVVFDQGFNDYSRYQSLTDHNVVFVTRLKSNAVFEPLEKLRGIEGQRISSDRRIRLRDMASDLCIVDFTDSTTSKTYRFLTNTFSLKANVFAELYKERSKIELFFKRIKQNLWVKTFLGSSPNALLTQLWIALCVFLLLTFLKFKAQLGILLTDILRLLQLSIFKKRSLVDLFKPSERNQTIIFSQVLLWGKL